MSTGVETTGALAGNTAGLDQGFIMPRKSSKSVAVCFPATATISGKLFGMAVGRSDSALLPIVKRLAMPDAEIVSGYFVVGLDPLFEAMGKQHGQPTASKPARKQAKAKPAPKANAYDAELITTGQAAKLLGQSQTAVNNAIRAGKLKAHRKGGKGWARLTKADVLAYGKRV